MFSAVDTDRSLLHEGDQISRSFLRTVLILSLCWSLSFIVGGLSGLLPVEPLHLANSMAFAGVTGVLLVALWRSWTHHRWIAAGYFISVYLYVAAAQFLMPTDQLRALLFFPALGAVLFVLGYRAAFFALLLSYALFGASVLTGHAVASPVAVTTFVATLGFTGLFFHIFHQQATQALRLVAQQNAVLDAAARLDPLTGLLNLRAFQEIMSGEMARPGAARPVAALFVDVDHFKPVNDRFGHAVGDAVLKALATVLKRAVRQDDHVARIGGEEFAIFLPGAGAEVAAQVAERVREEAERMTVQMGGHTIAVTLSVGVAVSHPPHPSPDALVRAADLAMYAAKDQGRNRVVTALS